MGRGHHPDSNRRSRSNEAGLSDQSFLHAKRITLEARTIPGLLSFAPVTSESFASRSPGITIGSLGLLTLAVASAMMLWGDPLSTSLAGATLLYAALVTVVTLPPAIVTALLVFRTNLLGRIVLQVLLIVWLFLPVYVHIAGWRDLFGPQGWLEVPNPFQPSTNLIDGVTGVIWLHALAAFPWVVFLTGVAFARGPASLEDDARLEASPWSVLGNVTLRRSWDAVLVAVVWIVITMFGEMSIASVCNVRTYSEVVFTGIPLGLTTTETGLTLGPGAILMIGLVVLAAWLAETVRPRGQDVETNRPAPLPLQRGRTAWSLLIWGMFLFALAPPLVGLIYKVGITIDQVDGQFVRGWSLWKAFQLTLSSVTVYRRELTWSLLLAGTVSQVTTLFALLLADIASRGKWLARGVALFCGVLFALPGPIVGLAIAWGTNRPWLAWLAPLVDRTIFAPTLAIVTITLPLVTFFYWHAMPSQRQLRELASLDGSSWLRTWWKVILPASWPTIVAGLLIGFVLAANDVAASVLVLPAGIDTISRRIFGLLHFGGEDNVAGILLLNLGVVAVLAIAIRLLATWRSRSDFRDSLP